MFQDHAVDVRVIKFCSGNGTKVVASLPCQMAHAEALLIPIRYVAISKLGLN